MKLVNLLAILVLIAFVALLLVGFENVLALFRYRVALFLIIGPLVLLFFWCGYKAFGPKK